MEQTWTKFRFNSIRIVLVCTKKFTNKYFTIIYIIQHNYQFLVTIFFISFSFFWNGGTWAYFSPLLLIRACKYRCIMHFVFCRANFMHSARRHTTYSHRFRSFISSIHSFVFSALYLYLDILNALAVEHLRFDLTQCWSARHTLDSAVIFPFTQWKTDGVYVPLFHVDNHLIYGENFRILYKVLSLPLSLHRTFFHFCYELHF